MKKRRRKIRRHRTATLSEDLSALAIQRRQERQAKLAEIIKTALQDPDTAQLLFDLLFGEDIPPDIRDRVVRAHIEEGKNGKG